MQHNTRKKQKKIKEYENCTYVEKGGEHAAETERNERTRLTVVGKWPEFLLLRCAAVVVVVVTAVLLSLCFRCFGFAWLAHDSDSLLATQYARTHAHT